MKVIVKRPEDPVGELQEIDNDWSTYQALVGGYIEVVPLELGHDSIMICNEEGKLQNFPPNINLGYDYIGEYLASNGFVVISVDN